jgi:hypothetical protein
MTKIKIFENRFADIYFHQTTTTIEEVWKPESTLMNDRAYKDLFQKKKELAQEHKPKFFVSNAQKLKYLIDPEMQEWTNEMMTHFVKCHQIEKVAYIRCEGEVEQLSLELALDESETNFPFQFFTHMKEAEEWLQAEELVFSFS